MEDIDISSLDRLAGLKFSEVSGAEIQDVDGKKVGKLLDAVFKKVPDAGLDLTKFTVGGGFLEEFLEDIGLKPDIDPVFDVDIIQSISPKRIKLKVPKSELKSTHIHDDAIHEDEIKLSQLSKLDLIDSTQTKLGNIIDIKFDTGHFKFICGDGFFTELLEDVGLKADIDFVVSPSAIETISDNHVVLSKSRSELRDIFADNLLPQYKKQAAQAASDFRGRSASNMYIP